MKRSYSPGLCALCGGRRRAGRVVHSIDAGGTLAVVRNLEAQVCEQCGEAWLADSTVEQLERIVHDARRRGIQVEIVALP